MFLMIVDNKIIAQALCFKKLENDNYKIYQGVFHPCNVFEESGTGKKWDTSGIDKFSIPSAKMASLYKIIDGPVQISLDDFSNVDESDPDEVVDDIKPDSVLDPEESKIDNQNHSDYKKAWMLKHHNIDVFFKVPKNHGMRLASEADCANCNLDNQCHVMIEETEGNGRFEKFCILDCHTLGYASIKLREGGGGLEISPKEPFIESSDLDNDFGKEMVTAEVIEDQEEILTIDDVISKELASSYFRYFQILDEIEKKWDGFALGTARDAYNAEIRELLEKMVPDYYCGKSNVDILQLAGKILDYAEAYCTEPILLLSIVDYLNVKFPNSEEHIRAQNLYINALTVHKLKSQIG